jgi:hypothetical protein
MELELRSMQLPSQHVPVPPSANKHHCPFVGSPHWAGPAQTPEMQRSPGAQAMPQFPQFERSRWGSMHVEPQQAPV